VVGGHHAEYPALRAGDVAGAPGFMPKSLKNGGSAM
jgi:hypothetical protein